MAVARAPQCREHTRGESRQLEFVKYRASALIGENPEVAVRLYTTEPACPQVTSGPTGSINTMCPAFRIIRSGACHSLPRALSIHPSNLPKELSAPGAGRTVPVGSEWPPEVFFDSIGSKDAFLENVLHNKRVSLRAPHVFPARVVPAKKHKSRRPLKCELCATHSSSVASSARFFIKTAAPEGDVLQA